MQLRVELSLVELTTLLRELTPIRIHMTPTDEDRRWLELESPTSVVLVPGKGIRVVTQGKLRYEVAGIKVPATIKHLQLLLSPQVVQADDFAHRLAFEITIEEGDLALIPSVIDNALVNAVNVALTPRDTHMVWDFGEALTKTLKLPERLEPLDSLALKVTAGSTCVDERCLSFEVEMDLSLSRTKPRPTDD